MKEILDDLDEKFEDAEENTLKDKYLTFLTDGQILGIPIADVVQIVGMQEITPVPEFPGYAKGIINMRGTIIPVIDVRLRLHKAEAGYGEKTCTIVTNIDGIYIGFIVDSVSEVLSIDKKDISKPPAIGRDYVNSYITGIGKVNGNVVLLLDTQKILSEKEVELITNLEQ
jgi:purine-binding chemotaxis protein CheW